MRLSLLTFLVPSYAEGLSFFVDGLGWNLLSNEDQGHKRWVTVAPASKIAGDPGGAALVLAVPASDAQARTLGAQTGDRIGFFLQTDDFKQDAERIVQAGGTFLETPRHEAYGIVAQWRDPWGGKWDLVEPK